MANNLKLTNEAVNAEADALSVLLDNGYLRIYDGTQAATADTALGAQVLLALESWTIALNVNTPATATGAASVLKRSSASNTCAPSAVSAVAA